MVFSMSKPLQPIPFIIAFLSCISAFATDVREQAFVDIDIAWCMGPGCFENGQWQLNRSPNCKYERRSPVIRAICDIESDENWRTADDWTIIVREPKPSYEKNESGKHHLFYLQKKTLNGKPPIYSINWNANLKGEPVHDDAQWNLGEDYTYSKHPDEDIHTIEGHRSTIVLNFECSLVKYPEPETTSWKDYYKDAMCNFSMLFRTSELISLHRARIWQLMKLKIEQIRSNDYSTEEHIEKMVGHAIKVQETWEKYASARWREVSASYGRGSGGPLGGSTSYLDLQVERIKDLLVVYK